MFFVGRFVFECLCMLVNTQIPNVYKIKICIFLSKYSYLQSKNDVFFNKYQHNGFIEESHK